MDTRFGAVVYWSRVHRDIWVFLDFLFPSFITFVTLLVVVVVVVVIFGGRVVLGSFLAEGANASLSGLGFFLAAAPPVLPPAKPLIKSATFASSWE